MTNSLTDERWEQLSEIRSMVDNLIYHHPKTMFNGYCHSIDWFNEDGYDSVNYDLGWEESDDLQFDMSVISYRNNPITEWTIEINYHDADLPTLTFNATDENLIEMMLEKIPQDL